MTGSSTAGSSVIAIAARISSHRDNVGLRTAMQRQTPLIYLHGIVQGLYEGCILGCTLTRQTLAA
jgi:hypothetical protein